MYMYICVFKSERPPSTQGPHLKTEHAQQMPHKPKDFCANQ